MDVVFARRLLNNLSPSENKRALDEIVRVIKVGGEARVYGTRLTAAQVRRHLQWHYGERVTVEIEEDPRPVMIGEPPDPQFHTYYRIVKVAR